MNDSVRPPAGEAQPPMGGAMNWRQAVAGSETTLPIFPLQTVLFPGGTLPLRVFEARYVDMVSQCLRNRSVFGINLIASGKEVGQPAQPHPIGVAAGIVSCDMNQPGILEIVVRGVQRFRILGTETAGSGLITARVAWLEEPEDVPLASEFAGLVGVLGAIIGDAGERHFPPPLHYDRAGWVGMRLAEVLPIPLRARQALLELDDPLSRVEIIREYLEQHGLARQ